MNPSELVKQLKIEKGGKYLIFVSDESGVSREDLAKIDLELLGASNWVFVYVSGNVAEVVKTLKVSNE